MGMMCDSEPWCMYVWCIHVLCKTMQIAYIGSLLTILILHAFSDACIYDPWSSYIWYDAYIHDPDPSRRCMYFFLLATRWWGTLGYHTISYFTWTRQVFQRLHGRTSCKLKHNNTYTQYLLLIAIYEGNSFLQSIRSGTPCAARWCSSPRWRPFGGGSTVQAVLVAQERPCLVDSRSRFV